MDTIGLEKTIAECLKVDGVKRERDGGEKKPRLYGDTRLIALLDQEVRAIAMDVTEDSAYDRAYQAYASGAALGYKLLTVPASKIDSVQAILSSNDKVEVRLPVPMATFKIGREEPLPEISAEHQRLLSESTYSPEGRIVIVGLYDAEAGICGTKGSWGALLGEYVTGLQGTNPRYSTKTIKEMLLLETATGTEVENVLKDLIQYSSHFN